MTMQDAEVAPSKETASIRIVMGIPHCPWDQDRVRTLDRLFDELGAVRTAEEEVDGIGWPHATDLDAYRIFGELGPTPCWEWSEKMWRWGAEKAHCTHFITLQDDARVAPMFWDTLHAMVEAHPNEIIGLEAIHPAARVLAAMGFHGYTTADCLCGVGYVVPRPLLREFLDWRARLKPGALQTIPEDTLIGVFALATGRRIWHPIPTIIDHDDQVKSLYDHDAHEHRRPSFTWKDIGAGDLEQLIGESGWPVDPRGTPHLGRVWEHTPAMANEFVEGFSRADYMRCRRDDGREWKQRLVSSVKVQASAAPRPGLPAIPKIFAAVPTLGGVHPMTASTLLKAAEGAGVELLNPWDLANASLWSQDIVRVRSRFVRAFLDSDASHLWFLDSDVSCEPSALVGMLRASRDVVVTPYPARGKIEFARAARAPTNPEAAAYHYKIRRVDGAHEVDAAGCVEIASTGLGCALIARAALEQLEAAHPELFFDDDIDGYKHPTCALFQLVLYAGELLSEDHSFCKRWRDIGGKVWLYLGPGSPATHHGEHAYKGRIETFGLRHRA